MLTAGISTSLPSEESLEVRSVMHFVSKISNNNNYQSIMNGMYMNNHMYRTLFRYTCSH